MLLTMVRGDTPVWTITVANRDGTPYNLASSKLWFSVRETPGALAYILQKTSDNGDGITVADPTTGVGIVQLANEDTAGLPSEEQRYVFDVQLKTTDDSIFTIQRGSFVISPDVTVEIS